METMRIETVACFFLDKASKKMDADRAMAKVTQDNSSRKCPFQQDPTDLRCFFVQRHPGSVQQQGEATPSQAVQSEELVPKKPSFKDIKPEQEAPIPKQATLNPQVNPVMPPAPLPVLAGRVAHYLNNWAQLTMDPWILKTVKGYHIEWLRTPFQVHPVITPVSSPEDFQAIQAEVQSLLLKQAVVPLAHCDDQFTSQLFLVEKQDRTFRSVINLKPLNRFVMAHHFKMEGSSMIKDVLQPRDRMCSVDLKDAYLSVSGDRRHLLFYLGWQDIRIHLPPFWAMQCTTNLYQASPPNNGAFTFPRFQDYYLS